MIILPMKLLLTHIFSLYMSGFLTLDGDYPYSGPSDSCRPDSCPPIHVRAIHVRPYSCLTPFMSTRIDSCLDLFMSELIHVRPFSCLTPFMSTRTHSCQALFMSDPIHVLEYLFMSDLIHVKPFLPDEDT